MRSFLPCGEHCPAGRLIPNILQANNLPQGKNLAKDLLKIFAVSSVLARHSEDSQRVPAVHLFFCSFLPAMYLHCCFRCEEHVLVCSYSSRRRFHRLLTSSCRLRECLNMSISMYFKSATFLFSVWWPLSTLHTIGSPRTNSHLSRCTQFIWLTQPTSHTGVWIWTPCFRACVLQMPHGSSTSLLTTGSADSSKAPDIEYVSWMTNSCMLHQYRYVLFHT